MKDCIILISDTRNANREAKEIFATSEFKWLSNARACIKLHDARPSINHFRENLSISKLTKNVNIF